MISDIASVIWCLWFSWSLNWRPESILAKVEFHRISSSSSKSKTGQKVAFLFCKKIKIRCHHTGHTINDRFLFSWSYRISIAMRLRKTKTGPSMLRRGSWGPSWGGPRTVLANIVARSFRIGISDHTAPRVLQCDVLDSSSQVHSSMRLYNSGPLLRC